MRLEDILQPDEILELARGEEMKAVRALLKVSEALQAEDEEEVRLRPRIDPVDCRKDFRYRLGGAARMETLRKQIAVARDLARKGVGV